MRMCTEGWQEKMQDSFLVLHFSQGPLIVSDLFNGELSTERERYRQKEGEKKTQERLLHCFCLVLLSQALSAITGMKDFVTEQH